MNTSGLALVVDALAGEDLGELENAALAAQLVELRRQVERLEAQWLRRLAVFDARGGAGLDGYATTAAWLRGTSRMGHGAAAGVVCLARALDERLPGTAEALAAGEVSLAHARALARETEPLPGAVVAEAEPLLLATARAHNPDATRRVAAHLRHVVDQRGAHADAEERHQRRGLFVSETWQGMVAVDGLLDPETGATVLAALTPLAAPAGPDDARSAPQRRADALAELCRRELDRGELPEAGGERPHLTVVVDLPTLVGRAGARAAEIDWVKAPLVGEAARRLACDASLVRVLTDGASQVLDVGRATRSISPALRRALLVRDGGCVAEGCDVPPPWTDAHHRVHWAHGGPTCLTNLCLLCRRHHRLVHDGKLVIETLPSGKVVARLARAP